MFALCRRVLLPALIVLLLACAAPAQSRFQLAMDAYNSLDQAGREAFLSELFLERSASALERTMDLSQLKAQQRRQAAILDRVKDGGQLSAAGLRKLLDEVDEQENAAIEKLAVEYRQVTRAANPDDMREIARRFRRWQDILEAWTDAGRPWQQQPQVIEWLQTAIGQQKISGRGQLPPAPTFFPAKGTSVAESRAATTKKVDAPKLDPPTVQIPKVETPPPVRREVARPVAPPETTRPSSELPRPSASRRESAPAEPPVQIGVRELRVRIQGYHLALADIVYELADDTPMNLSHLEGYVEALASLATRRKDMMLYWNLLSAEDRNTMPSIQTLDTAINLAASQTAQARKLLEGQPQEPSLLGGPTDLERLDKISRRLATLSAESTDG